MKIETYRILWKGQITGPYERDQVEEMLSKNEIGIWAEISEGNSDWKPISEWRVREPAFRSPPPIEKPRPAPTYPADDQVVPDVAPISENPDLPPLPDESAYQSVQPVEDYGYENDVSRDGGFFYWSLMPLRKYGVFTGRARRKEYWLYTLLTGLLYALLIFAEGYFGYGAGFDQDLLDFVYLGQAVVFLGLLIPNLAVTVRRLHDTNRSGWWVLISLTGIGSLVLLLFAVQEGTKGENEYGPDSI